MRRPAIQAAVAPMTKPASNTSQNEQVERQVDQERQRPQPERYGFAVGDGERDQQKLRQQASPPRRLALIGWTPQPTAPA